MFTRQSVETDDNAILRARRRLFLRSRRAIRGLIADIASLFDPPPPLAPIEIPIRDSAQPSDQ